MPEFLALSKNKIASTVEGLGSAASCIRRLRRKIARGYAFTTVDVSSSTHKQRWFS